MRVVLSADMEGISQITDVREVLACSRQYWETGQRRMNADVAAAAEGLLAGGASEVIVLDNHGSGNPRNLVGEALPEGARLEAWNVFDLPAHGVDAQLQVGYHARCGVDAFISHTYIPRLRLRVGGELISESHGRVWAGRVPLIGIIGNANHQWTLGSLSATPFLAVQESTGRTAARPVHGSEQASLQAIRDFARDALRDLDGAQRPVAPSGVLFEATLPGEESQASAMEAGGWRRRGPSDYYLELAEWAGAREPLDAAMGAAIAPFAALMTGLDMTSPQAWAAQDPERLAALETSFLEWCRYTEEPWPASGG